MNDITYVGLDVHKATVCMAIAESGRGGEVREVGIFENRPDVLRKMVARLGKQRHRLNFCYEAGPCGYGLPFADRFGARLHRGGTIADSDEGGRPGQDRSL